VRGKTRPSPLDCHDGSRESVPDVTKIDRPFRSAKSSMAKDGAKHHKDIVRAAIAAIDLSLLVLLLLLLLLFRAFVVVDDDVDVVVVALADTWTR
jgi:hypothetical protein